MGVGYKFNVPTNENKSTDFAQKKSSQLRKKRNHHIDEK
jgi:hypothetical protein